MSDKGKKEIKEPNIVLCEGNDLYYFMIWYLTHLIEKDQLFKEIWALDFGGVTELKNQIKALMKMPNFNMVKNVLVIRDAETDYKRAKTDIIRAFNANDLSTPSYPGEIIDSGKGFGLSYLLLPSCDDKGEENGTLEDLCLRIIKEEKSENISSKADAYLRDLEENEDMEYPRIHKNRLHVLISSYDKYVGSKVGEAGKIGLYDWDDEHLDYLKDTLHRMVMKNDL